MGDVKRSGKTFEERKSVAMARQKVEGERGAAIRAEIEANKTPEQKLKERRATRLLPTLKDGISAS